MIKKFTFLFLIFLFSKTFLSAQGSCASPDGSFFGFDGSFSHTYATANANGWCYNNLNPGQTYCWTYFYPSSGDFMMDIIINGSCGNCDGGNLLYLGTACSISSMDSESNRSCSLLLSSLRMIREAISTASFALCV